MASSRVVEREVRELPRHAAASNPDFCNHKYSLVIIIGQISHPSQAGYIGREIERGIRSWDVDLTVCNLNQHLRDFLSHHTLQILKGTGQRCLRYSSEVLDTLVLISPSQESVSSEVCSLLGSASGSKLLVLAGQSVEETGDLLIQRGLFSPLQLTHILTEQVKLFTDPPGSAPPSSLPASRASLTLSCPNTGRWKTTLLEKQPSRGPLAFRVNPPEVLPAMEALAEFTSLLSGTLSPPSPFDLLQPPGTVGFLKLSRPCCYVFPAGRGDCAFFAVNGFTVLVDGGSDSQACFWKLVRHLDRVDALLLTHVGTENLAGVNALLERKVAELEMGSDVKGDLAKRLISPEIGVVFFNAPNRLQVEMQPDGVLRSKDQAALTLRLLKKLDISPQPLSRPRGASVQPLTLFQKMGVGRLELYVLNPARQSPEYQALSQGWPDTPSPTTTTTTSSSSSSSSSAQTVPVTALASVCALLVWHPACPQDKVVRVLFPGVTPQGKLLEGLEKLRGLAFLQRPTVTSAELENRRGGTGEVGQTESQEGKAAAGKEAGPRSGAGKERANREEGKKEGGEKEKNKAVNGNGVKEEAKKEGDKLRVREGGVKGKAAAAAPSDKTTARKGGGTDLKKEDRAGKREESGPKKKGARNEPLSAKPKSDDKNKPRKEAKNEARSGKAAGKPKKEVKADANLDTRKTTQGNAAAAAAAAKQAKASSAHPPPPTGSQTGAPPPEGAVVAAGADRNDTAGSQGASSPEDMTDEFLRLRREEAGTGEAEREREEAATGDGRSDGVSGRETDADGGGDRTQKKPPADAAGFPAPLTKRPEGGGGGDQLDLTPTEYTLLEGGLRESPPSRPSPDGPRPPAAVATTSPDPDEETAGPASSSGGDASRPNSAGHTPYCLSPDDVWRCGRDDRADDDARGRSSSPEAPPADNRPPPSPGSHGHGGEGQSKTAAANAANAREKHLSFLSLGSLKEGLPDASPSVATTTTTTTHSLPAEVSSPQSTEVDESLSMSFEQQGPTAAGDDAANQPHAANNNGNHFAVESDFRAGLSLPLKKPRRSLGPPGPNAGALHFESPAHDVDLCLVSPCEFKHFKPPDSAPQQPSDAGGGGERSQEAAGPRGGGGGGNNNNNRDVTSASESNAPPGTEECPSTTAADGVLDSDDESCGGGPPSSLRDPPTLHALPPDPPPAPLRDAPPLPPQPGSCMPVPAPDAEGRGRGARSAAARGRKLPGVSEVPQKPGLAGGPTQTGKTRPGAQSGATKGVRNTKAAAGKSGCKAGSEGVAGVYVDLAYLPSGSAALDVEFFRRVRSSCYIISGDSPEGEGLMRPMLDSLLEAKAAWPDSVQVTLIPTYESPALQEWYQQTLGRQGALAVSVLGSNSTVAMQDETFPACKIEF